MRGHQEQKVVRGLVQCLAANGHGGRLRRVTRNGSQFIVYSPLEPAYVARIAHFLFVISACGHRLIHGSGVLLLWQYGYVANDDKCYPPEHVA